MDYLFSPWRASYHQDNGRSRQEDAQESECVFCLQIEQQQDHEHFILHRYKHHIVMLNKFPYNPGHLLIIPYQHVASLMAISQDAHYELATLTSRWCEILTQELKADGINIGCNMGRAAGAGIPSHLHTHILPRFYGDTNFLPTLAETKNIALDLRTLYNQLKEKE